MISNYVSAKVILNRLYRELGSTTEIVESDAVEWISDALSMIGSYAQYDEIACTLELTEGRAKLPNNFHKIVDISYNGQPLFWSSQTSMNEWLCADCKQAMCDPCDGYTFYINSNYIITDIDTESPDNKLCITYLGAPVDSEGYPMVPDDIYFFKACVAYVTYLMDYREWRKGNVPDKVYKKSEQDWLFYVNSARGSANMPNAAQLENLKNITTNLIPRQNDYSTGFRNTRKPERRKRF